MPPTIDALGIRHVGWSLGNYCNAKCDHCYSWKVRQSPRTIQKSDVDRIIGQLCAAGVTTVNLGGNEPLYTHGADPRKSLLPYIIEECDGAGLTVGATTNGTTALWLAKNEPAAFDAVNEWHFSIDSPFPEEHDKNRGGAFFDLVFRALGVARDRGARVSLVYCAMRGNMSAAHADMLLDLAQRNSAELRINTLKPTDPHHSDLFPTRDEVFEFFAAIRARSEPVVVGESILGSLWGLPAEGCPCGTTSLRIHSIRNDGRVPVSPCVFLHDSAVGDLLTQDLNELVRSDSFVALRSRRESLPGDCRTADCGFEETCRGGCAARAQLWHGTLDAPDPYCPVGTPADVLKKIQVPCTLRIHPDRIRVHKGYLCTVITKPEAA